MGKEWCLILLLALEAMLPCSEGYSVAQLLATKNLECKVMRARDSTRVHWVAHSGGAKCTGLHILGRQERVGLCTPGGPECVELHALGRLESVGLHVLREPLNALQGCRCRAAAQ